jgi:hypothetical protein
MEHCMNRLSSQAVAQFTSPNLEIWLGTAIEDQSSAGLEGNAIQSWHRAHERCNQGRIGISVWKKISPRWNEIWISTRMIAIGFLRKGKK